MAKVFDAIAVATGDFIDTNPSAFHALWQH